MVADELLHVIQSLCSKQHKIAELTNFELISKQCGIEINKLPLYLEMLRSYGLVSYSEHPPYVYLTAKGRDWSGPISGLDIERKVNDDLTGQE